MLIKSDWEENIIKKLLTSLSALSLAWGLGSSVVVACDDNNTKNKPVPLTPARWKLRPSTRRYSKLRPSYWNPWAQAGTIPGDAMLVEPPVKFGKEYLLGTTRNGFYSSNDGLVWKKANLFQASDVGPVFIKPFQIGNTYFIAMNNSGLWSSPDLTTWTRNPAFQKSWNGMQVSPVEINQVWYLGTQSHGLWKSVDQGTTWTQVGGNNNLPTNVKITVAPYKINKTYFVGTNQGLWTSNDKGQTWTQVGGNNNLPTNTSFYAKIIKIKQNYFVGTLNQGLWKSTNLTQWTQVGGNNNLPKKSGIYAPIVEYNNTYFLATTDDGFGFGMEGLWNSKDGLTWQHMTGDKYNLPAKIQSLTNITYLDGTYYFVSRFSGLWTSDDAVKWTKNIYISNQAVLLRQLEIIDNYFYLSTSGQGLYLKKILA